MTYIAVNNISYSHKSYFTDTFKYKTDFGEISVLSTEMSNWKIKVKTVTVIEISKQQ
jgi:hypothetical protein